MRVRHTIDTFLGHSPHSNNMTVQCIDNIMSMVESMVILSIYYLWQSDSFTVVAQTSIIIYRNLYVVVV